MSSNSIDSLRSRNQNLTFKTTFIMKEQVSGLITRKERRITMPKNIFISFMLLVCILLAFIGNACTFIHPVGEEEYEILISLLTGTFKKIKKEIKKEEDWN